MQNDHDVTSSHAAQVLNLDALPGKMAIVGGGYIALEFAGVYNNFGTEVHVLWRQVRGAPPCPLSFLLLPSTYDDRKRMHLSEFLKPSFQDTILRDHVEFDLTCDSPAFRTNPHAFDGHTCLCRRSRCAALTRRCATL